MRVLLTTGDAYIPQIAGGVQSSTHQLALQLIDAGHQVAVACGLWGGDWTAFKARVKRKVFRTRFARDQQLGYPVYRAWDPSDMREVALDFRADVAVIQNGGVMKIARNFQKARIPLVLYFRNVEFDELGGDPSELSDAQFISNSSFTAQAYARKYNIESVVIPPLVRTQLYRTETSGEFVTFINPFPEKGFSVAIEVARQCPDINFLFVESWKLSPLQLKAVLTETDRHRNIKFERRTNSMKNIFGRTRILLAPSQWEEAWGRVASEAHCSGIPVVGSNRGGLPEAIGPGGLVLEHDAPTSEWAAAVRLLWSDAAAYGSYSSAAKDYANRPQMDPNSQFQTLMSVLNEAVASPSRSAISL